MLPIMTRVWLCSPSYSRPREMRLLDICTKVCSYSCISKDTLFSDRDKDTFPEETSFY